MAESKVPSHRRCPALGSRISAAHLPQGRCLTPLYIAWAFLGLAADCCSSGMATGMVFSILAGWAGGAQTGLPEGGIATKLVELWELALLPDRDMECCFSMGSTPAGQAMPSTAHALMQACASSRGQIKVSKAR